MGVAGKGVVGGAAWPQGAGPPGWGGAAVAAAGGLARRAPAAPRAVRWRHPRVGTLSESGDSFYFKYGGELM